MYPNLWHVNFKPSYNAGKILMSTDTDRFLCLWYQGRPDAGHGLLYLHIRVILISEVQTIHQGHLKTCQKNHQLDNIHLLRYVPCVGVFGLCLRLHCRSHFHPMRLLLTVLQGAFEV